MAGNEAMLLNSYSGCKVRRTQWILRGTTHLTWTTFYLKSDDVILFEL